MEDELRKMRELLSRYEKQFGPLKNEGEDKVEEVKEASKVEKKEPEKSKSSEKKDGSGEKEVKASRAETTIKELSEDLKSTKNEAKETKGKEEVVQKVSEQSVAVSTNAVGLDLISQKQVKDQELKTTLITELQNVREDYMVTRPTYSKPVDFSSLLGITKLNKIPILFSIISKGSGAEYGGSFKELPGTPRYLEASRKAFAFGVREVRVVLKSQNFPFEIEYSLTQKTASEAIMGDKSIGPSYIMADRLGLVMYIFETLFKICRGSQFILFDIERIVPTGIQSYAGDLVTIKNMLKRKFVDQDIPLLPAAAFGSQVSYLPKRLQTEFEPEHHHMRIGEISIETVSGMRIFSENAVITDQYVAALNRMYIQDLLRRNKSASVYLSQHRVLTFPNVSVQISNPSVFSFSIVPMWKRDECDGTLLLYMISSARQKQYVDHLRFLLMATKVLAFRLPGEVLELSPIKRCKDHYVLNEINKISSISSEPEIYELIAMDSLTTYLDVEIITRPLNQEPVHGLFTVFGVLLWFNFFPAIAVDNGHVLMYELFTALQILIPKECDQYLLEVGYINTQNARKSIIDLIDRESYISGLIKFPFMLQTCPAKFKMILGLQQAIHLRDGRVVNSLDGPQIDTPRMFSIRKYFQPWSFMPILSSRSGRGESPNACGARLAQIMNILMTIVEKYKERYRAFVSKSAFGAGSASAISLVTIFGDFDRQMLESIGIRFHCEIFRLRELVNNSIYQLGDTFDGSLSVRQDRPQISYLDDVQGWRVYNMQRQLCSFKFESVLYLFYTIKGITDLNQVVAPDTHLQYLNLRGIMEEGIVFGDILAYVNSFRFGEIGSINRNLLGIGAYLTSVRAERLFELLSKTVNSNHVDVFKLSLDDYTGFVDIRARSYKIILNRYRSLGVKTHVIPPRDSEFNRTLVLARPLMDRMYNAASSIFVPEESPVDLFTRGLFIQKRFVSEMDPTEHVDVIAWINEHRVTIIPWSNDIVSNRVGNQSRLETEIIMRITGYDGQVQELTYDSVFTPILFLVTSYTGSIEQRALDFLMPFFQDRKISFLLTDLLVSINRLDGFGMKRDINLENQFTELLTRYPSERVVVDMYDTTWSQMVAQTVTQREKWLFAVQPILQKDVVIKGVSDLATPGSHFKISPWYMWAYGVDGKSILFKEGEDGGMFPRNADNDGQNEGQAEMNRDERVIPKLSLGYVNFNNPVQIIEKEIFIKLPEVVQVNDGFTARTFMSSI